jgi:hypothetical protein
MGRSRDAGCATIATATVSVVASFFLLAPCARGQNSGYRLEQKMFEKCADRLTEDKVREFEELEIDDRLGWLEANCATNKRGSRGKAWEIYERCKIHLTPAQTLEFESSDWEARKRFLAEYCKEAAREVIEAKPTKTTTSSASGSREGPATAGPGGTARPRRSEVGQPPVIRPPGYAGPRVAAHVFIWLGLDAFIAGFIWLSQEDFEIAVPMLSGGLAFCIIGGVFAGVYAHKKEERGKWDAIHAGPVITSTYAGFGLSKRF